MNTMPKIDLSKVELSAEEMKIVELILKKDGSVRCSKPKVDKSNPLTGKAAYLWRMVVWAISPIRQHQCLPTTADFDLPAIDETTGKWSCAAARMMSIPLEELEKKLVNTVPVIQRHGTMAWGRALGAF